MNVGNFVRHIDLSYKAIIVSSKAYDKRMISTSFSVKILESHDSNMVGMIYCMIFPDELELITDAIEINRLNKLMVFS